jgi:hypothetical protein
MAKENCTTVPLPSAPNQHALFYCELFAENARARRIGNRALLIVLKTSKTTGTIKQEGDNL